MRRQGLAIAATAVLLATLFVASTPAAAHPPEKLTLIYNERLEILTAAIRHDVKDGTAHYIMMARVYLNGALVIERMYEDQERDSYNERFALTAKEGDTIMVCLCCNIEGCTEQELVVGKGITFAGSDASWMANVVYMHAAMQLGAFALTLLAIPGGMGFYRAWKSKTKPTGRRRRHVRIGQAAVALWAVGSLGGIYLVYLTSGDFLGSPHGWMAIATFVAALFAGYSASPRFRPAGYGSRMSAHMPLSMLTVVLGVITVLGGMMTAGMF